MTSSGKSGSCSGELRGSSDVRYTSRRMPDETPDLAADLNQLADELHTLDPADPVLDEVAEHVTIYNQRVNMARALHRVDHLLQHDVVATERRYEDRMRGAKEQLRDELRRVLEQAKR